MSHVHMWMAWICRIQSLCNLEGVNFIQLSWFWGILLWDAWGWVSHSSLMISIITEHCSLRTVFRSGATYKKNDHNPVSMICCTLKSHCTDSQTFQICETVMAIIKCSNVGCFRMKLSNKHLRGYKTWVKSIYENL